MLATGPFKEILSSESEARGPDEWYNSAAAAAAAAAAAKSIQSCPTLTP